MEGGFSRSIFVRKIYIRIFSVDSKRRKIIFTDDHGRFIREFFEDVESSSVNVSDYRITAKSLQEASKYCREKACVFTPNKLLVNHFRGICRVKDKKLLKLLMEIRMM